MPVEPNAAQDKEMKTNGEEAPSRTFARHEVIAGITSCVTPDEKHAPGNNMKRLQERDLAEASGDPPVLARHASNKGTSGL